MPMHWYSPIGWWICPIFMILFFIIFIVAMRRGFRPFCFPLFRWRTADGITMTDSPKDILDRRYAAGDITQQEYEATLKDISGS